MSSYTSKDIIEQAEQEYEELYEHVRDAADWFHANEGDLFLREDACDELTSELDISTTKVNRVISELVGDHVDPIVQVSIGSEKYIGVVEYVEGDVWYGYTGYHDMHGEYRRVVSAQDVKEKTYDNEIRYAQTDSGSFAGNTDATYEELAEVVQEYHKETYPNVDPADVETGASLVSGTTISGNTAWHAGNDGGGSGLAADTIDGTHGAGLAKLSDGVEVPVYATKSDVPTSITKGEIVYIDGDSLYVEDGT